MSKTILAIDPGGTGAIATWRSGKGIKTIAMPKTHIALRDALREIVAEADGHLVAYLEEVGGFIRGQEGKQPGSAMFNFGKNYGQIEMALLCMNIPTVKVKPEIWQKTFNVGTKKDAPDGKWKHHLKARLGELMPELSAPLYAADSALICIYGYKREFNTEAIPF
ncbi:MAG: hypothetical protein KY445_11260 [Armatimonadetes bacterium]|nr:hypothetical protein [Armatimonadota bacterium]